MPPVNLLIKPASSACNMDCAYCFYKDVAANREKAFEGMLSLEGLEKLLAAAMEYAEGSCTLAFQGGEPSLAGLDFYKALMSLEEKYKRPGVKLYNTVQTNGYGITEEWAAFFAENRFLLGLSLDGPADIHDRNRRGLDGKGSFNRVLHTARLFDKYKVEYNILSVVTGGNVRSAEKIYNFFKKQGFRWLQFIPCLDPMEKPRGSVGYHLSTEQYSDFLIKIFDLWYRDLLKGEYVSIRHIDNWVTVLLGGRPEACGMSGRCSVQFVVEGDGGVYPCDFYVLDKWRLGTVGRESFREMANNKVAEEFVSASLQSPEPCRECQWYFLCANGCKRDRLPGSDSVQGLNYHCAAYKKFFSQRFRQLQHAAAHLRPGIPN